MDNIEKQLTCASVRYRYSGMRPYSQKTIVVFL